MQGEAPLVFLESGIEGLAASGSRELLFRRDHNGIGALVIGGLEGFSDGGVEKGALIGFA